MANPSVLITAGPTHEPIDAVRFIGNRSSGRMGAALASSAREQGCQVILLMGPATVPVQPAPGLAVERFCTCEDLRSLLARFAPTADLLIMAAAVADYRPKPNPAMSGGKFRRSSGNLTLELEPTPDLLAEVASHRRPGQFIAGFALEPRAEMIASGRAKLARKSVDAVLANPLETMDSPLAEGTLLLADGAEENSPGRIPKADFARWLISALLRNTHLARQRSASAFAHPTP